MFQWFGNYVLLKKSNVLTIYNVFTDEFFDIQYMNIQGEIKLPPLLILKAGITRPTPPTPLPKKGKRGITPPYYTPHAL